MKKDLHFLWLFMLCIFANPVFAQTGPGGVGNVARDAIGNPTDNTELILWLRPGSDGNTESRWKDESGWEHDFTSTGTGLPVLNSSWVNGYDAYTFNGTSNYFHSPFKSDLNPDQFSIFLASKVLSTTIHKAVISSRNDYPNPRGGVKLKQGFILYALPAANSNNWTFWSGNNNTGWDQTNGTTSTVNNWASQNINYQGTTKNLSVNFAYSNAFYGMKANTARPFSIGSGFEETFVRSYFFKGDIGEVIMYNRSLTLIEQIIVNNYLAAKYNFKLSANDNYTQDDPAKGNFDHNVAGIGKVSGSESHLDSQGTGIVRINNPTTIGNYSLLFWGEDVKDSDYNFTTNATNYMEQLNTKWRVSKSGTVGPVDVSFEISKMDLTSWNGCKELQLIVSSNANFTTVVSYNLTVSGNYAKATGVTLNEGNYFTVRYISQIVWDGTKYYNGAGIAKAPDNSTDHCLKLLVKVGSKASLSANAYVNEIEVIAGATLEAANNVQLSVVNNIENNGTIDLVGEAQLIQEHTGISENTGTGILKRRQQGTTNLYNYNYWSSPVNQGGSWQIGLLKQNNNLVSFTPGPNANPNTSPVTLSSRWLYNYNASSTLGYYGWNRIGTTTSIRPGIGYTMKGSGSILAEEDYVFSGEANSGDYMYLVTNGYDFLIGNPYPSALDAEKFILDNINVTTGTLYFYEQFATNSTHNTSEYQGGYATLNLLTGVASAADPQLDNGGISTKGKPTKNIAVGQGFFVSIDNDAAIKFHNSQRVFAKESTGDSVFYLTEGETANTDTRIKYWLSFTDPSGISREIALGYDENASKGVDKGYDAIDYSDYPDNMLWDVADNLFVIQGLKQFDIEDDMPLTIKITTPGTYNIKVKETLNFPKNTTIYLKDNEENRFYDLSTQGVSIMLQAGTYKNRFSIVYQSEILNVPSVENGSSVFVMFDKNSNTIQLLGIADINTIKAASIYAVDGKQVISYKEWHSETFDVSFLNAGFYLLKLEMTSGVGENIRFVKF